MTKDVLISIRGKQEIGKKKEGRLIAGTVRTERTDEPIEVIVPGRYYEKNGGHFLLFEEIAEDGGKTATSVKIRDKSLEMTRRGAVSTHMVFERGGQSLSYYQTGFGTIRLGIQTSHFDLKETEERIDVSLRYDMEVNYEHYAECFLAMSVTPRAEGLAAQEAAQGTI